MSYDSRTKHKLADYEGRRVGAGVVVGDAPRSGSGARAWMIRCDCGSERPVLVMSLVQGKQNACRRCSRGNARGRASHSWRGHGWVSATAYCSFEAQAKRRGIEWALTIEYVDALYAHQDGKCALTGDDLYFFRGVKYGRGNASLDRIDSSVGYVDGNVQLVTKQINFAKQSLSQEDFVEMCMRVADKARAEDQP